MATPGKYVGTPEKASKIIEAANIAMVSGGGKWNIQEALGDEDPARLLMDSFGYTEKDLVKAIQPVYLAKAKQHVEAAVEAYNRPWQRKLLSPETEIADKEAASKLAALQKDVPESLDPLELPVGSIVGAGATLIDEIFGTHSTTIRTLWEESKQEVTQQLLRKSVSDNFNVDPRGDPAGAQGPGTAVRTPSPAPGTAGETIDSLKKAVQLNAATGRAIVDNWNNRHRLTPAQETWLQTWLKQLDSDDDEVVQDNIENINTLISNVDQQRIDAVNEVRDAFNLKWQTEGLDEALKGYPTNEAKEQYLDGLVRRELRSAGINNPTPEDLEVVRAGFGTFGTLTMQEGLAGKGLINTAANAVAQGFASVKDAEALFDSVLAVQDTLDDGKGGFIDIGFNTEQLVRGLATGYSQGRLKLTDALDYLNDINTVAGQRMQEQRLSRQQRFMARQEEQRIRESRETEFARLAEKPTEEMRQYLNTLGVLGPRLPPVGTGRRIGGADIYQRMQEQRGFEPAQFREIGVENIPVPPITSAIADAAQRIAAAYPETTARKLLS